MGRRATDEVYFRDTAHGFLAWAVATLVSAAFLSSAIGAPVGIGAQAGGATMAAVGTAATSAGVAAAADSRGDSGAPSSVAGLGYFTDSLFRGNASVAGPAGGASAPLPANAASADATASTQSVAEVGRIFVRGLQAGSLAADDTRYVGQLVAAHRHVATGC